MKSQFPQSVHSFRVRNQISSVAAAVQRQRDPVRECEYKMGTGTGLVTTAGIYTSLGSIHLLGAIRLRIVHGKPSAVDDGVRRHA